MTKWIYLLAIVIYFSKPALSQSQSPLHDSIIKQLKSGIEGFKDRYHSPAIVVAIIHDKEIIFSESLGYIDVENKISATIDSKFPILSVTKTFTATMFMQLMERKTISFDSDVRKYIPEYRGNLNSRDKSPTTLFQLATHTSGLPRNSPADIYFTKQIDKWILGSTEYATLEPANKKEFLQSLKFIRKEYSVYQLLSYGDRYYSNLGYSLLGIALERAAKSNYENYVINKICKPLKMTNSGFDTEKPRNSLLAKGYYYDDSLKNSIPTPVFNSNAAVYAGGMYSTASDLAKYISFQFDNGMEANKILSKENRAMMYSFKIGWKPYYPFVLHEGAMLGYRCQVYFNPDLKIGWVILTNTSDFEFSKINEYFSKLIIPLYNKKPVTDLDKYIGTYRLDGGYDSLRIYLKKENLYSSYLEKTLPESPLVLSGNNRFKAQGKGNYSIGYDFITDESGEIKILNMGQLMWVKQ